MRNFNKTMRIQHDLFRDVASLSVSGVTPGHPECVFREKHYGIKIRFIKQINKNADTLLIPMFYVLQNLHSLKIQESHLATHRVCP